MDEERDSFVYELKETKDGRNIEIKKKKKEERMEIRLKDHLWING